MTYKSNILIKSYNETTIFNKVKNVHIYKYFTKEEELLVVCENKSKK